MEIQGIGECSKSDTRCKNPSERVPQMTTSATSSNTPRTHGSLMLGEYKDDEHVSVYSWVALLKLPPDSIRIGPLRHTLCLLLHLDLELA